MKVIKGQIKAQDWRGEAVCSQGARGGCTALLAIDAADLYVERAHVEYDPKEAVQGWVECYVVCPECSTHVFVYNVPRYVAEWALARRRGL